MILKSIKDFILKLKSFQNQENIHYQNQGTWEGVSSNDENRENGPNEFDLEFNINSTESRFFKGTGKIIPKKYNENTGIRQDVILYLLSHNDGKMVIYKPRKDIGFIGAALLTHDKESAETFKGKGVGYLLGYEKTRIVTSSIMIKKIKNE